MCNKCNKDIKDSMYIIVSRYMVGDLLALFRQALDDYFGQTPRHNTPLRGKCPAMKALESLTPSGSEFWEDPDTCSKHVRNRIDTLLDTAINKQKQINSLRAAACIASMPGPLEVIDRICGNCAKTYHGTAYGCCNHCGRFP